MSEAAERIRLDKWLWYARFFKTRSLAAKVVTAGQVRVNAEKTAKSAHSIGPGDTLTFPQGDRIRVVKLVQTGTRRGPAAEAQALYEDLTPPNQPRATSGGERPTKRDRRAIDSFRSG